MDTNPGTARYSNFESWGELLRSGRSGLVTGFVELRPDVAVPQNLVDIGVDANGEALHATFREGWDVGRAARAMALKNPKRAELAGPDVGQDVGQDDDGPALVGRFRQMYPGVDVTLLQLTVARQVDMLLSGDIDVGEVGDQTRDGGEQVSFQAVVGHREDRRFRIVA